MVRVVMAFIFIVLSVQAFAQVTTAFTYQGELERNDVAADGNFDFRFLLYEVADGGFPLTAPADTPNVLVTAGLFTAEVDFGFNVFGMNDSWLEIQVRAVGGGGYTILAPRQKLTPTPIATHAMNVEEGAIGPAQIADEAVGAGQVDASAVQLRISSSCTPGSFVQSIGMNGVLTCGQDQGLVTVTGADIEDGTIGVADLADNSVGAAEIISTEVQERITGSCASIQAIRTIGPDGSVTCAPIPQGDITGINTSPGNGLNGGCSTGTCSLGIDPTDFNGTNPIGSSFSTVFVTPDSINWHTITSFSISSGSESGEVLITASTEADCTNCQTIINDISNCELGISDVPSGTPISSRVSNSRVGYENGTTLHANMTTIGEFNLPANTVRTYFIRGRSSAPGRQCTFDNTLAGGFFVPD